MNSEWVCRALLRRSQQNKCRVLPSTAKGYKGPERYSSAFGHHVGIFKEFDVFIWGHITSRSLGLVIHFIRYAFLFFKPQTSANWYVCIGLIQILWTSTRVNAQYRESAHRLRAGLRLWRYQWDSVLAKVPPREHDKYDFFKTAIEFWYLGLYLLRYGSDSIEYPSQKGSQEKDALGWESNQRYFGKGYLDPSIAAIEVR